VNIKKYKKRLNILYSEYLHEKKSLKDEKRKRKEENKHLKASKEAQAIIQEIAKNVQQEAHRQISDVVSSCLSTVFNKPYEFRIIFEKKRGKTEARVVFVRNGLEIDPLSAAGGGIADIAAFGVRVACLCLYRPRLRRFMVLDEPFKFVSAEYKDNVRQMLEEMAENIGIQFLIITHDREYEIGKVIRL